MDGRRSGALAALAILGKLDFVSQLLAEDHPLSLHLTRISMRGDDRLIATLAEHWGAITADNTIALDRFGLDRDLFFEEFERHLNASPAIRECALALVENASGKPLQAAELRFLEKEWPRSERLEQVCLKELAPHSRSWRDLSRSLTAAEILARNSGRSAAVDAWIKAGASNLLNWSRIVLLSELSSEPTDELDEIVQGLQKTTTGLPIPVGYKLRSSYSDPDSLRKALTNSTSELKGQLWDGPSYWLPNLLRRIHRDEELANLLSTVRRQAFRDT